MELSKGAIFVNTLPPDMINNLEVKHATVDEFSVAVCWIKLVTRSANFNRQ